VDIHSETSDPDDDAGARMKVWSHEDPSEVAYEAIWFDTDSWIRIYKDGRIELHAGSASSTLTLDGSQNKITMGSSANLEITASEKILLDAPLVECAQDLKVNGNMEIAGSCTCSNPPCSE
jgi:hypothetical protein